jgi:hypothetical protein
MAELKKKRPWTVLPHSALQKIDENLWAVENNVPGARFGRRMCIIKRRDGSLLFFNAIPLDEATLKEVQAWGKPTYLVMGHHQHAMDAEAFREKLGLKAYGPKECEPKLRDRVLLTGRLEDIPNDSSMDILSVPGTVLGDTAIILRSGDGARVSVLVSDVLQNTPKEATAFIFHLLGFTGGPKVVPAFRLLFIKDKAVLKNTLRHWAEIPNLRRLVPFHGSIVEDGVSQAIKSAAERL